MDDTTPYAVGVYQSQATTVIDVNNTPVYNISSFNCQLFTAVSTATHSDLVLSSYNLK